jgi:DNA ligase D
MAKKWGDPIDFEVEGRSIRCSNPERPYFPEVGLTKRDVVGYYAAVSDVMLRYIIDRPTTLERWPTGVIPGVKLAQRDGTKGEAFYQKRVPQGAPDYVETCTISFPSGRTADEVCPTEPAVLVWLATLGTITMHPWPVRRDDSETPDELRLDFDPQPGTAFADSVQAALAARELIAEWGWSGYPKTSGGRGVHVYVRIQRNWTFTDVRHAAIAIGRELERRMPGRVTTKWWKEERGEAVFVDYNQNARDRTIAAALSVRARPGATVSTPVSWEELGDVDPADCNVRSVPGLLADRGDPWVGIDDEAFDLTPALDLYARDERDRGLTDMPYPPQYPKMSGEPKRVQPSRARDDT